MGVKVLQGLGIEKLEFNTYQGTSYYHYFLLETLRRLLGLFGQEWVTTRAPRRSPTLRPS